MATLTGAVEKAGYEVPATATDLAITGMTARYGTLIKDAEALEAAHAVTTVVFDRTGTLTEGKPAVVAIEGAGKSESEVLQFAQAVQKYSDHPLAKAVHAATAERNISLLAASEACALPGRGVQADVDGATVVLVNCNS